MMLFLTALDAEANPRDFSYGGHRALEDNLDFLTTLVTQGHTLLSAYIIEDNNRTDLPLAAFDGVPISAGIHALQLEWERILSRPPSPIYQHRQDLIDLTRHRLHHWEVAVGLHQQMVHFMEHSLHHAQAYFLTEPRRSRFIDRYEAQLASHQAKLAKARFYSCLMANRLNQLLA